LITPSSGSIRTLIWSGCVHRAYVSFDGVIAARSQLFLPLPIVPFPPLSRQGRAVSSKRVLRDVGLEQLRTWLVCTSAMIMAVLLGDDGLLDDLAKALEVSE